jgi:hypothetical protein
MSATGFKLKAVGSHTSVAALTVPATLTQATGTDFLAVQAFGGPVRYTIDGTTPSATVGFRIAENDSDLIPCADAAVIKVIEEDSGNAATLQFIALRQLVDTTT